jgi:ribosomal-protein-alanine N-acetyltransferase
MNATASAKPAIEHMLLGDVDDVMRIERVVFPTPWSVRAFRYDLSMDRHSHYFVIRGWQDEMPPLLAYAGFWLWADEAHIGTIAVHPEWQGRGLGEWMLLGTVQAATGLLAQTVTLEVRVSNKGAQALYQKLGFRMAGRRRMYYSDTGEDGLIMTLHGLQSPQAQAALRQLRSAAHRRLCSEFDDAELRAPASGTDVAADRVPHND